MVGRIWLVIMLVFRILILATVGSDMFEDEQEEFVCNTMQPGCKQVCYDKAFPISHYRFWVFHIVVLSVPTILFVVYSVHQNSKIIKQKEQSENDANISITKIDPVKQRENIQNFYIANVLFRLLAEVALVIGQWKLYDFKVEPKYSCERLPCPNVVDCFVSRPTEKTIFLCFYFGVGVFSAVISLIELVRIIYKNKCKRKNTGLYEQDNQSNREQEKSRTFLMQELPLSSHHEGRNYTVPNHFSTTPVYKSKSSGSTANSNKSSRSTAKGDLKV